MIKKTKYNNKWTHALRKPFYSYFLDSEQEVHTLTADYSIGLVDKQNSNAIAKLFSELFPKPPNNAKANRLAALQAALYSLNGLVNSDSKYYGVISPESNTSHKLDERYMTGRITRQTFNKVLKELANHGWLHYFKGGRGKGHFQGIASLFLVTDKLTNWLAEHEEQLASIDLEPDSELILLKTGSKESKRLCSYGDNEHTNSMRERVRKANELRYKFEWTYQPLVKGESYWDGMARDVISHAELKCKRIFLEESFDVSGRFYCPAQPAKKGIERETIWIDGEATIEIDYKSHHPRLMYHKANLEAPEDCYAVDVELLPSFAKRMPKGFLRTLLKGVFMRCANASSQREAITSVAQEYTSLSNENANELVESFEAQHKAISGMFYQSAWRWLQALDSKLTDDILNVMTNNEIPVLPIHDSYLVRTRDADILRSVMFDVYENHLGFEPRVSYGK